MQLLNGGMLNLALMKQDKLDLEDECIFDFNSILGDFVDLFKEHVD